MPHSKTRTKATRSRSHTPASTYVIGLKASLSSGRLASRGSFELGDLRLEIKGDADSLWAIVRRPGKGGIAIRLVYAPGGSVTCKALNNNHTMHRLEARSALGDHHIAFTTDGADLHRLRVTIAMTPASPLLVPFMPRDILPLDAKDNPLLARGNVEAAQRGLNTGLLYFHIDKPAFGNVLYVQNLTALNPYFNATQTKPDGAVGGIWPELGYLLPTPAQSGTPPTHALPAGTRITLSDAILVFRDTGANEECHSARQFIQMLGAAYGLLDRSTPAWHDWVARAETTLRDLDQSPKATVRYKGHRYAHPYTDSEYPDSMVQLSLLAAVRDYGAWRGTPAALEQDFLKGLEAFFDPRLKTLRRYLPNVGKEKDADAVDSWYLYHPLMNLARLALHGEPAARDLFLRCVDFAIKAARHFKYLWPVQFNITDFSVITPTAPADGEGQTDVGGLYAWVMLQGFELTGEERFLDEARASLNAAKGMRFNINYQANLTAWGVAACLRLWRITNVDGWRDQGYIFLASFFHNSVIWESEIGGAAAYTNFMGVTCLQDAPYMAIFECFDSFTAFEHCLRDSGPELEPAARLLMAEYCKYALDRAWFYYPDALPSELLAEKNRNGHIDRKLSFPLEDLYVDGQQTGQVGQEIYGAGAALIFASRMFHPVSKAPFRLFCDHFIMASERSGERAISISLAGAEGSAARLSVIPLERQTFPSFHLATADGEAIEPECSERSSSDRIAYTFSAEDRVVLSWEP